MFLRPSACRSQDRAAEKTDHPRDVIGAAPAHVVQNEAAAYAHSDLFDRRRLMADWPAYVDDDPEQMARLTPRVRLPTRWRLRATGW